MNLYTLCISGFFLFLTFHISASKIAAQELSPVINCSGGETFYAENYSLDFVIGEPISESFEMQQTMLTQGFLQDVAGPTAISETAAQQDYIQIYPIPANKTISIDVENELSILWYDIINIYGDVIGKTYCDKNLKSTDVSCLQPGFYLLRVGIEKHDPITKRFIKK